MSAASATAWNKANPEKSRAHARASYQRNIETRRARSRATNKVKYDLHRERLNAIKMERGCIDCGYAAHPAALDFDHRDPATKSFGIGSSLVRTWVLIEAEVAKCDVRCANCHRVKTYDHRTTCIEEGQ
jgi:hypothetical protein